MNIKMKHGDPPYQVVLVHGGPGAAGEMRPVAEELSSEFGILEPHQSADTIEGQILEHNDTIVDHCDIPVTLVGHSWGAWLSLMIAHRNPEIVRKLILIGCGPFHEDEAMEILETRNKRLDRLTRLQFITHMTNIASSDEAKKVQAFHDLGKLFHAIDSYDPLLPDDDLPAPSFHIFDTVWDEGRALRKDGAIARIATEVSCPVVIIHGDYDPHPYGPLVDFFSYCHEDVRCFLLEKCGHTPWLERQAREQFFHHLRSELRR
jgi:pimeloyl-ACP methyl ester carboxylesterase